MPIYEAHALDIWRRESSRSEDAEDKLDPLKSSSRERESRLGTKNAIEIYNNYECSLNFFYKVGGGCCLTRHPPPVGQLVLKGQKGQL